MFSFYRLSSRVLKQIKESEGAINYAVKGNLPKKHFWTLSIWREAVSFDGLTYRVHDFGPGGDSDANSIWIIENRPKVAFVGDLIFNGLHPYIADDHIQDWLKNLERARDLLANITTIYPGHGQPGSIDLIDSQKRYLLTYIDEVRQLSGGNSSLTKEAKMELIQRMEEFLPDAGLSFLIAQSADPVAAELAATAGDKQ